MNSKHIHVVAFNVPFPADYGGVIDVFYRLKAMHDAGVLIHLHCFDYGRGGSNELDQICEEVHYYPRYRSLLYQFSILPFIVKTRNNSQLLDDLLKDEYPILFEGLHSCYFLDHRKLKGRKKIVRSHNVEHDYYQNLSLKASGLKDRVYFKIEALKLKRFEKVLSSANHIAAISETDLSYFQNSYGKSFLLPPSHPNKAVKGKPGKGDYILYHGNLSVQENEEAVFFMLDKIAPNTNYKIIIAGKDPSVEMVQKVEKFNLVELIPNPSFELMEKLVVDAHINFLPTFQATGFKLKLLNALFNGRFCLGTPELVEGTGLDQLCVIAKKPDLLIAEIKRLFEFEFTSEEIGKRKALLEKHSNSAVISDLLDLL